MLASLIIVFREIIEIALILSVVIASTVGVPHRNKWIFSGIGLGVLGSLVVAYFADIITQSLEGFGQEVLNAVILGSATLLIAWTIIWMKTHGKELSAKVKQVGAAVASGEIPLYTIAIVIALTVLREGSEIVLFTYGLIAAGTSTFSLVSGAFAGGVLGIIVGILFYLGLIRLSTRYIFTVTTWLLTLLSAGLAAQAAGYLIQAGLIPSLYAPLWDTSKILADSSFIGQVFHILIGYDDRPSAMQVIVYCVTLSAIVLGLYLTSPERKSARASA